MKFTDIFNKVQLYLDDILRKDHDEVVMKQTSKWATIITWTLMGGTAMGIGWLALAKTEEIVVAPGKLEPLSGVIDVQMPLQGVAKTINIEEGEHVKKGQILIQLDTEASKEKQAVTLEALELKEKELEFKQRELSKTIELSNTKIKILQSSLRLGLNVLGRYKKLTEQGAAAELQYLEQEEKVQRVKGEIKLTIGEEEREVSVLEQGIRSIKGQIAELKGKSTEANVMLRYQAIVAPVDGIVFDLKALTPGFVARTSEPILKIVPIEKLQANVEVESRNIGFIKIGVPADISIDSFPATDFGVIEGEVIQIGSDALAPEPAAGKGYRFPAKIGLNSQTLRLKSGKKLPLQVGMSLTANIKLRKVTYLQLLLGSFKDKADSLRSL